MKMNDKRKVITEGLHRTKKRFLPYNVNLLKALFPDKFCREMWSGIK